ncbi:MAG TPA: DUF2235 domain-containing protein [Hymenobacter sp.]|jgi:hypothetical protein
MSIFSKLLRLPPGGLGRVVVGESPDNKNKTGIPVTVAIFFDGTKNNRNNTAQRHMAEHNKKNPKAPIYEEDGVRWSGSYDKEAKADNSFANGYSNVSILEALNLKRKTTKKEISLYIEGIGTLDDDDDTTRGAAFGSGDTGIVAKVNRGVGQLAGVLTEILSIDKDTFVEQITIDVFGFSRGAAAARHFVSLLQDKRPLAVRLGAPRAKVIIKFVGVFDTVSSYGVGLSFGSSVSELGLALGGVPQKVVHLTAGDECRENFSLTNITSSLGSGYELTLPGVHSDVGGGYGEVEDETRTFGPGDRARLLAQGWYTPDQLRESTRVLPVTSPYVSPATIPCLVGTRRALRWHYQFISLRLMATQAKKHDVGLAGTSGKFAKYALPPGHELLPVQAAIETAAAAHKGSGRHVLTLEQLPLGAPLVHRVRNRYLHQSVSDSIGMSANYIKGQPRRRVYPG